MTPFLLHPPVALTHSRTALQLAEVEREGGISPHVSPMTGGTRLSLGPSGCYVLTPV